LKTIVIDDFNLNKKGDLKELPTDHRIFQAVKAIQNGQLVAFPTETVYGLGANAMSSLAVKKIFEVKGRPRDNPMIVHVAEKSDIIPLTTCVSDKAVQLIDAFMPGPLTLVLNKSSIIPYEVTAGLETVAVRIPAHPIGRLFIRLCRVPIAAPSANLSGRPSPTSVRHVLNDLTGKVEFVIDGGFCEIGLESTVVDITGSEPVILRPGAVTAGDIRAVCGCVRIDSSEKCGVALSPGMKYRHYAPKAKVLPINFSADQETLKEWILILLKYQNKGTTIGAYCSDEMGLWIKEHIPDVFCICYGSNDDIRSAMSRLYYALRKMDDMGIGLIVVQSLSTEGLGAAYMNRLLKAAGENSENGEV
jgi:L-threonylcarbamoyladenylate synthase